MMSMYCNQIESHLHHTLVFVVSAPAVVLLILLVVASYMCWYWLKGRANRRHLEDDDSPHCWICLEEGPNKLGQPLRRDCACRGSGGISIYHVSPGMPNRRLVIL